MTDRNQDFPTKDQLGREFERLLIADETGPRRHWPALTGRRSLVPLGVGSVAALVIAIFLIGGPDRQVSTSSAAEVLERAADAELELAPPLPGPGEFLYVKSEDAFLTTYGGPPTAAQLQAERQAEGPVSLESVTKYQTLVPSQREVWLGDRGSLLVNRAEPPVLLSEHDRHAWRADGSPGAEGSEATDQLGKVAPIDTSTDPVEILSDLRKQAEKYIVPPGSDSVTVIDADGEVVKPLEGSELNAAIEAAVLQEIGRLLRESSATPEQRAALFQAASMLEGMEVDEDAVDPVGRSGVGVSLTDPRTGWDTTFVFDRDSHALLAEEYVVDDEEVGGYPIGTVVGYSSYLGRAIVGKAGQRP